MTAVFLRPQILSDHSIIIDGKIADMPKINRKKAILDAAVDLFAENGFSATSTLTIAKKARVAEGLIFHYFKNKNGILFTILDDLYQLYVEALEEIVSRPISGLAMIEEMADSHFFLREKMAREFQVLDRDIPAGIKDPDAPEFKNINNYIHHLLGIFRKAIVHGQQDGSIRKAPPDELALIIRGALLGISNLGQRLHLQPVSRDLSQEVGAFIRRGIGSHMEESA